MSREIKFRAWDGNEMIIDIKPNIFATKGNSNCPEWFEVEHFEIMQYTGLQDDTEDQNELYKDDIVEIVYENNKHICVIDFFAGGFAFVSDSLPDSYIFLHEFVQYDREYGWVEDSKKLGNIYEHPHLLGEKGETNGN